MAPRWLETREQFIERLRRSPIPGPGEFIGVGEHHFSHAVVVEHGVWRIRRLHLDPAKVAAYRATHSSYMPEDAEALSEPGPDVVLAAGSLAELIEGLQALPWPLRLAPALREKA